MAFYTTSFNCTDDVAMGKKSALHNRRKWELDNRGVAFLEFTILFPLLLILSLGVFEFGRAMMDHHKIDKAVRDAARYLARVPATCTSAGTNNGTIDASYITNAKNLALNGTISGGTPLLSYWTNASTIKVSVDCVDATSGTPTYRTEGSGYLPIVTVSATVPYSDLGFLTILGLGGFSFDVHDEQLNIGE